MMITSHLVPQEASQAPKSLNSSSQQQEAKTPEIETVLQLDPVQVVKEINKVNGNVALDESKEEEKASILLFPSSLSERALKVKENLNRKEESVAVLLKADGSSEEIKYIASSKNLNQILNGRPTIVGEFEEIGVIIVRSLNQRSFCKAELNKNILPPPFCNQQFYGNYLLFAADAEGNPINFFLKQYQEFVDKNQDLTQQIRQNYNSVDDTEIKARSSLAFGSDSVYFRSEADKRIRQEFQEKHGRNPTASEIEEDVKRVFQQLVDGLTALPSDRMVDPDYDPNQDTNAATQEKEEPELDWRLQLKDALQFVRERGRFDGSVLAERIAETFYELNGAEASLNELIAIFTRIKAQLIEDETEPFDSEESAKFDAMAKDLLYAASSTFLIKNGRSPTKAELKQNVKQLADELVEKALEINESDSVTAAAVKMSQTPQIKSKTGISETYDLYFDDCGKKNKKRKAKDLKNAIKSFAMRNRRQPSCFEVQKLKSFLATKGEATSVQFEKGCCVEEKEEKTTSNVFSSPVQIKTKGKGARAKAIKYNIYFENEECDEKQALKWFKRFNNRDPTESESNTIKRFIKSDRNKKEELIEYNFPINDGDEDENEEDNEYEHKISADSVVEKKASTKYVLNFGVDVDENERQNGDEKQAVEWFQRFNNRQPTESEQEKIKQFVQYDYENDTDTIDID